MNYFLNNLNYLLNNLNYLLNNLNCLLNNSNYLLNNLNCLGKNIKHDYSPLNHKMLFRYLWLISLITNITQSVMLTQCIRSKSDLPKSNKTDSKVHYIGKYV